ncbi:MAG: RNA-binding protein [Ruminococcus sp.]|nr:RNA-binding protein [Ruminococcus sp.]
MSKSDYAFLQGLEDEDVYLLDRVSEWIEHSEERYKTNFSAFLDDRQSELVRRLCASKRFERYLLWGGYEDAERNMLCVYPPYEEVTHEDFPMKALNFSYRQEDRLTHRDILGALMSLGIKRDSVGDILVGDGRSFAFLRDAAAQTALMSIEKIGRVGVKVTEGFDPSAVKSPKTVEKSGFAASLRADCVLSIALGLSREKCARLIKTTGIAVDHLTRYSPDTKLSEGCRFSVRGYGKFLFKSIDGVSKKDRIHITICKFV